MLKTATCDGRCWILIVICAVSLHHAELHLKICKIKDFYSAEQKNQMTNVNSVFFHYVLPFGSFISGGAFPCLVLFIRFPSNGLTEFDFLAQGFGFTGLNLCRIKG